MIDLHTHTNVSDGDLTPEGLINYATEQGVKYLAITDHDTVDTYTPELTNLAKDKDVILIPGIELSTVDEQTGEKIHVLGLTIDPFSQSLRQTCADLRISREKNAFEVADKLTGCGLSFDPTGLIASGEIITKAHIAREVLAEPSNRQTLIDHFGSMPLQGSFIEEFLIKGCPAFVAKSRQLTPLDAVEMIHKAGGLAFCAHPSFNVMRGFNFDSMKELILRNKFDGVEAINIQYDKSNGDERFDMVEEFLEFTTSSNLLVSGGSDFHSNNAKLWGNHSSLGLKNEAYQVNKHHLDTILNS